MGLCEVFSFCNEKPLDVRQAEAIVRGSLVPLEASPLQ